MVRPPVIGDSARQGSRRTLPIVGALLSARVGSAYASSAAEVVFEAVEGAYRQGERKASVPITTSCR